MYKEWGSHVGVLGASVRTIEHINSCTEQEISAMTIPFKLVKEISDNTILPQTSTESGDQNTTTSSQPSPNLGEGAIHLVPIEFKKLEELPWAEYDIEHELTVKGLEKFAADWNALCE
jgi:transaldolase